MRFEYYRVNYESEVTTVAVLELLATATWTRVVTSNTRSVVYYRTPLLRATSASLVTCMGGGLLHSFLCFGQFVQILLVLSGLRSFLLLLSRSLPYFVFLLERNVYSHQNANSSIVYFINHIVEQSDRL